MTSSPVFRCHTLQVASLHSYVTCDYLYQPRWCQRSCFNFTLGVNWTAQSADSAPPHSLSTMHGGTVMVANVSIVSMGAMYILINS